MSKSLETNYTAEEYLEIQDSVSGAVITLQQAVDNYVETLGEYVAGEDINDTQLSHSVDRTVDALERVYDSLNSFDDMLDEENLVARIQRDDKKGFCDLEDNLERLSGGLYDEVNEFDDLLVLFEYVDRDSFEADEKHLQASSEQVEAPTKIVHNKDSIEEIRDNLEQQYERIIHTEVIARRSTEDDITFDPEPPIFRMLGDPEYKERLNKLNNGVKKLK